MCKILQCTCENAYIKVLGNQFHRYRWVLVLLFVKLWKCHWVPSSSTKNQRRAIISFFTLNSTGGS